MDDKEIWQKYLQGELPEIDQELQVEEKDDQSKIIIDLHNHTEDQAYELIVNMINQAKGLSCRNVEVITGLGSRYPEEPGKLFQIVPKWLEQMVVEKKIKKFKIEKLGALTLEL